MPRRKDHTRDEIKAMALAAGVAILQEEGAAGLTARAIARRIGYTVGTLYNVFLNFTDLILYLNAQTMDNMYAAFQQVIQQPTTGRDTIDKLTQAYIEFAHTHAPEWQLLFEARVTDQPLPDWYQLKIRRLFDIVEQALLPLLNGSAAKAALSAKVLWASLYGICILSITGKVDAILGETAQSLAKSLVDNYLFSQNYPH